VPMLRITGPRSVVRVACVLAGMVTSSGAGALASDSVEKKLDFPSPVQWKIQNFEVSLIGVAWGPANSPEMISKSQEDFHRQKAEFYPDRPYVLALNFRAKVPNALSSSILGGSSGLARIKNVDGEVEWPMGLTQSGFVPFTGDLRFNRNTTTEYWDLFPASADQKEFLFEVFSNANFMAGGGPSKLSFKINRKYDDFIIVNASLGEQECQTFTRKFTGTMGVGSAVGVTWQLTRQNATISGTEQYSRIGTTLWLQGTADSLGNVVIEERYPKDQAVGIFKGHFSQGCQSITGLFSKPDGTKLQPFEFREAGSHPDDASGSDRLQ
jgi:hypothetical protein